MVGTVTEAPKADPGMPKEKVLALMQAVLEKIREGLPAWEELTAGGQADEFLAEVLKTDPAELSIKENKLYIVFLIHVFASLENPLVRGHALKLVHLALWTNLTPKRLQFELLSNTEIAGTWKKLKKAIDKKGPEYMLLPRTFIPKLVSYFTDLLNTIHPGSADQEAITYCERFVEFITDLICQLPTRRFFLAYLEDAHLYAMCTLSKLYTMPEGELFRDLLGIFEFYQGFEIDNFSGTALDNNAIKKIQTRKLIAFQRVCLKYFPERLQTLAMCNLGLLESRKPLKPHLDRQPVEVLQELATRLGLVDDKHSLFDRKDFLLELLLQHHDKRPSHLDEINALALYPNEDILWDFHMVPSVSYKSDKPLALPKLNLQFLTFHDYLLRNFNLFRLESTYEVREDIQDAVIRLDPRKNAQGEMYFKGLWKSRMTIPIEDFLIKYVGPADIGQIKPHDVRAVITIDLGMIRGEVPRREWDEIRQHDVMSLITLVPHAEVVTGLTGQVEEWRYDYKKPFLEQYGIKYVRGCEVMDVRDDHDNVFTGIGDSGVRLVGTKRTIRVHLDSAQYHADIMNGCDCYQSFHILMRRKPKENNYKAVLESIRDLMNTQCVVPEWMHDVFLGYGDPDSAHYKNMPDQVKKIDFVDSLLDVGHVQEVYGKDVVFDGDKETMKRPFLITFPKQDDEEEAEGEQKGTDDGKIHASCYKPQNPGPYPEDQPKMNDVRFTSVQMEAMRAGTNPGLTLVVGPPGTGKTDVAVQMLSNIYHNCIGERTLIVTHSNNALNDIFQKLTLKNVDERHLLRLGGGHKDLTAELESHKDFSKHGRVQFMLERRLIQLREVRRIADAVGIGDSLGDVDYTCETAAHFYRHEILARWERFMLAKKGLQDLTNEFMKEQFPFHKVFDNVPDLFDWEGEPAANWYAIEGCWKHITKVFEEIEDCRAFELFKSSMDRGNYLLCRQAKVIAMTCTFAALKRKDLVRLKFEYDNILMEEAAQILEIETFIPMLLQNPDPQGGCRLKRIILIGDHNQLPPVVKNMSFQKYSHFDQSLFARFVRLGVPVVQLNAQGRMRSSLADLYRWRYQDLGDLPHVASNPAFKVANAGLTYEYQCIDVPAYNGVGETQPQPHFFQNLGEAEYIVATYMYMRLLGYPAEKITILTTYNGQKFLIRDVLNHRCGEGTIFGMPSKVTTVDKFQGRQNDYILLSLVRTESIGHVRDVRRMVVAVSRARLGLYVFCRTDHFKDVWELKPFFGQLLARPTKLALCLSEMKTPTTRKLEDHGEPVLIDDLMQLGQIVDEMTKVRVKLETAKYEEQHRQWEKFTAEQEKTAAEASAKAEEEERQAYIAKRMKELKAKAGNEKTKDEEEDDEEIDEAPEKEDAEDGTEDEPPTKKAKTES